MAEAVRDKSFGVNPVRAACGQIAFGFFKKIEFGAAAIAHSRSQRRSRWSMVEGAKVRWLGLNAWLGLRRLRRCFVAEIGSAMGG